MNTILAPLVRGLCINASGSPRIVIAGTPGPVSPNALVIDLESAYKLSGEETGAGERFDEETAAKALSEAYAAWEFEMSPSAVDRSRMIKKQPSCIVLNRGSETLGVFWIDRDIDAARKRRESLDDSFIEEIIPPARDTEIVPPALTAAGRAGVVKNRTAVVTGGAQGFGEQISLGLAASGALVFIADVNQKGAEALAKKINAAQGRTAAIAVVSDVTREDSVEAMFAAIAEQAGGIDLCISNAGVLQAGSVMEQELKSFRFTTQVNYEGYFIITKFAGRLLRLQHLTAQEWKTDIIQINSKSGLEGSNKNGAYAGGKFGGIGLTESFALELIEYNVKVNSICPGNFFDGPLWADPEKGLFVQYLAAGKVAGARTVADVKSYYENKVPMRRGCEGPDVMRAIYYIVEQEYETGQAVPVTGGQVMLH
ncbi:MAG: SDR family NAD(P)-dependent oxidoreductase [Spirochaetaceae bacterium]|jgi:sorbitol-6-phosphate 2-dehydrogenase|nr:SDR family NAD(P)-dependent oxidoreductase [Spirochaetaceae bacterium]